MIVQPWRGLRQILDDLDNLVWKTPDDRRRLARVIMTFKHTRLLTSSALAAPVPPSVNVE